jgi:hypothetical protein
MWLAVRKCAHLSVGWAQKLAQSISKATKARWAK